MNNNPFPTHHICAIITECEPVEKTIKLKVEHDGITVDIDLTEDEALEVIKKLAKQLDVADVLAAVTKAVKAK